MTSLSLNVSPLTDNTIDLFGKDCDDLQENIVVGNDAITGTLKYVTDYTGFDASHPELQSGNYITLVCESNVEGVEFEVTVTNPVTLDPDGIVVLRIADKSTQTITVVASKEGYDSVTKVFNLTGLTCEES